MAFSRRSVLAASVATSFLGQRQQGFASDPVAECRSSLGRLFPSSLDQARALGRACAEDGADVATLLDRLCRDGLAPRLLATAPLGELRAAIDAQIRADYARGRTRRIDGWVLSRTETRIFAILAG